MKVLSPLVVSITATSVIIGVYHLLGVDVMQTQWLFAFISFIAMFYSTVAMHNFANFNYLTVSQYLKTSKVPMKMYNKTNQALRFQITALHHLSILGMLFILILGITLTLIYQYAITKGPYTPALSTVMLLCVFKCYYDYMATKLMNRARNKIKNELFWESECIENI